MEQKFEFGAKVKDSFTGFTGKVIGYGNFFDSGYEYLVAPPCNKDGTHVDGRWISEKRLVSDWRKVKVAP